MSGWVKTSVDWFEDPLVEEIGADAAMLHLSGLAYCARHLTDGHLPTRALRRLYPVADLDASVKTLVEADKWQPIEGGFLLVEWADHILSADEVDRMREQSRISSERYRRHKNNDHSMCDRCSYVRKHGDAVTDAVTDSVNDAPPVRTDPLRTEGEERGGEEETGSSASSDGSAPLAASSPPPPGEPSRGEVPPWAAAAEPPPDVSVWVDWIEIKPDGTQVVHDELKPKGQP
jgi:hypothetical protein